ncbi:MAG: hypothetical protein MI750_07070 [Xanthomonadales bacterium]|nr:hypothetical protein [Xanthomonadales bacterium]
MKTKLLVANAFFILALSSNAFAVSETGTGLNIQVAFQDNVALIQIQQGETVAVGRAEMQSGYAVAPLDAFNSDGVKANWGHIELLKHCGGTDVILSQPVDGVQQETWIDTLEAENCQ